MLGEVPQPSVREMAARLGVAFSNVQQHLLRLEKKGAIRSIHRRRRGITILRPLVEWPAELVTASGIRLGKVAT